MKTVGIICEYNPFHNGHAKQLRAIDGVKVCLMSGNFVQRGEPAIMDKYVRAKAALLCGADLVLELPVTVAIRSAEGFADGGVDIFDRLGCIDELSFGSEHGNIRELLSAARCLLSEDFPPLLRSELASGISFPAARQRALERLGANVDLLTCPNDILALEYCKALLRRNSAIVPHVLRREGNYHESFDAENPSASTLRSFDGWDGFVPAAALEVYRSAPRYHVSAGERAWLARLRSLREEEFAALPYGSEGLWRKVMRACRTEATLSGIIAAAKSKRYTHTRLMRLLLCAYLGISEEILSRPAPYVRVLAASSAGQAVLRRAKKSGALPLINAGETPDDCEYRELERRVSDLYGLFCIGTQPPVGVEKAARIFLQNA